MGNRHGGQKLYEVTADIKSKMINLTHRHEITTHATSAES